MRMKPKLCVDIDNVMGRTDDVIREMLRVATISEANPTGIKLEYEDVVHFDYPLNHNYLGQSVSDKIWKEVHEKFLDPNSNSLELIQPMPCVLQNLREIANDWDILIVTSRKDKALGKTRLWIEKPFSGFDRCVFSSEGKHKFQVAEFSAAIDDYLPTVVEFHEQGVRSFLYDHPWNRNDRIAGLTVVTNWDEFHYALMS
jgi:hypothetical protein